MTAFIEGGGVTSPKGYTASGVHCGVRRNREKKDLALIVSAVPAQAAAVYTKNLVKGAPLTVTRENLESGQLTRAVICNSGNANACAEGGEQLARDVCALVAESIGASPSQIIVASTGVIGEKLDMAPFRRGVPAAAEALSGDGTSAAEAIMTTDLRAKSVAVEFDLCGVRARAGGIAKGSGMINPNMATMLAFLTTDAAVSREALSDALSSAVEDTFNMITVDGDTSTNDMVAVMANGLAANAPVVRGGEGAGELAGALKAVCAALARMVASDGEGATKLLEVRVSGAADMPSARLAAKSVAGSSLVKTAMFGSDANWGRVLCALGYSGAAVDPASIDVSFSSSAGSVTVCRAGRGVDFDETVAKRVLGGDEIVIGVELGLGTAQATALGCDLSYEYVRINGDYRT